MKDSDVFVTTSQEGYIQIWLRGVLYTTTNDLNRALNIVRQLRWKNQKIAC